MVKITLVDDAAGQVDRPVLPAYAPVPTWSVPDERFVTPVYVLAALDSTVVPVPLKMMPVSA